MGRGERTEMSKDTGGEIIVAVVVFAVFTLIIAALVKECGGI